MVVSAPKKNAHGKFVTIVELHILHPIETYLMWQHKNEGIITLLVHATIAMIDAVHESSRNKSTSSDASIQISADDRTSCIQLRATSWSKDTSAPCEVLVIRYTWCLHCPICWINLGRACWYAGVLTIKITLTAIAAQKAYEHSPRLDYHGYFRTSVMPCVCHVSWCL